MKGAKPSIPNADAFRAWVATYLTKQDCSVPRLQRKEGTKWERVTQLEEIQDFQVRLFLWEQPTSRTAKRAMSFGHMYLRFFVRRRTF